MAEPLVRAVFLDIGGTVVDPDPSFYDVVARVCGDIGLSVTPQDVERAESAVWAELEARGLGFPLTAEESRRFWHEVYALFSRHLGISDRADLPDLLYSTFLDLRTWRCHPDAREAILTLRDLGYRVGAVSNWETWLEDLLQHLGIRQHLDFVICSSAVGVVKPDPLIYQIALDHAGLSPSEVVHVGDNPLHDAAAASSVGITPVLVDRRHRYTDFDGLRVTDLRQLPALLENSQRRRP